MITIVIADDQALFREGLRTLLSIRPDMDVVGEAADGDEAVALVEALQPNVVLMDLRMPRVDGIQATARIRQRWPEIPAYISGPHEEILGTCTPGLGSRRDRAVVPVLVRLAVLDPPHVEPGRRVGFP